MSFSPETRDEREALRQWLALAQGTAPQTEPTFRLAVRCALRVMVGEQEPGEPAVPRVGIPIGLHEIGEFLQRVQQAEAGVSAARTKLSEIAGSGRTADPQARRTIGEVLAELEKTGDEWVRRRDEHVRAQEQTRLARMVLRVRALHLGERSCDEILRRIKEDSN
jgi:hypothetical protein